MVLMALAEILILTSTMEEIIEDLFNKEKVNFSWVLILHKDSSDKNQFIYKANLYIILGTDLEEIVT